MRIFELYEYFFKNKKIDLIFDKIFVIIIMLIMSLGVYIFLKTPTEKSYLENRSLKKFQVPTLKNFLNKSMQDNIEKSLSDQFPYGRTIKKYTMKYLNFIDYTNIDSRVCSDRNVYVSKDYVIYNCSDQIMGAPVENYNEKVINRKMDIFSKMNDYIDTSYYALDRAYAWDFSKGKLLFDSYEVLKNNLTGKYNISRLDVNNYDEFYKYFYKTDHHWNYLGSYQGYIDIFKLLGIEGTPLKPTSTKTLKNFYGSQAKLSKVLSISEDFIYYDYDLKEHSEYIDGKKGLYGDYNYNGKTSYMNYYEAVYGRDFVEVMYDYNAPEKDNLLILGTSYTDPVNRLVASHFNKTFVVDARYYKNYDGSALNLKDYIDDHHIDRVLVLASTDVIVNNNDNMKWGD